MTSVEADFFELEQEKNNPIAFKPLLEKLRKKLSLTPKKRLILIQSSAVIITSALGIPLTIIILRLVSNELDKRTKE